jgi:tetratricopeptide (TPR) repeat protein
VYSSDGTVIYSSNHIQTHLRDRSLRATPGRISLEPKVLVVDFFTDGRPVSGERVDPQQLAGLVFQNLAAEALARGELQRAYWLVQGGLEHDPRNAQLYNVLGVLHQRLGASDRAEDFYRYALDRFGDELIILRNLYYLLLAGERTQEAARIEQRIAGLPDPDPYPLLQLGDEALLAGDARRALRLYGEARRKAPHLHEVYGRIADVQLVLANPRAVRAALEQALATALRERDREIYRRRLDTVEGVRVDP